MSENVLPNKRENRQPASRVKYALNHLNGSLQTNDLESARTLCRESTDLASEYPENPALREEQAKGAVNCILWKSGNLERADVIYQELAILAWNHSTELGLTECRLRGGMALIQYHVQAKRLDAARLRQEELLRVCQSTPNVPPELVGQLQNMVPTGQD